MNEKDEVIKVYKKITERDSIGIIPTRFILSLPFIIFALLIFFILTLPANIKHHLQKHQNIPTYTK